VLDQPIAVQALPRFDNQRRLQRKRLDFSQLFFKRNVVAFHELCVNAAYLRIFVSAVIYDKIDTAILLVVGFESMLHFFKMGHFAFQLLARKC